MKVLEALSQPEGAEISLEGVLSKVSSLQITEKNTYRRSIRVTEGTVGLTVILYSKNRDKLPTPEQIGQRIFIVKTKIATYNGKKFCKFGFVENPYWQQSYPSPQQQPYNTTYSQPQPTPSTPQQPQPAETTTPVTQSTSCDINKGNEGMCWGNAKSCASTIIAALCKNTDTEFPITWENVHLYLNELATKIFNMQPIEPEQPTKQPEPTEITEPPEEKLPF